MREGSRSTTARGVVWAGVALLVGSLGSDEVAAQNPVVVLDTLAVRVASRASPGLSPRTRTVEIISRAQIERLPARSIGDVLRWANGVDLQQRSGSQADISLRGAGFEQVLVLVDGVRVSDVQSGHFDLDLTVPLDRIERIEILRGAASALFGADAVGGVIHIVTFADEVELADGPNDDIVSEARVEGGSFGTWRLSSTQGFSLGDARVSLGEEWGESDGDRPGTDFSNRLFHGDVAVPVGGGRMTLAGGYAARDFGAADFYAPIPAYEETRTGRLTAGWTSGDLGGARLEARANYRSHHDRFVFFRHDPESGFNEHDASQIGGEVLLRHGSATSTVSTAFGVEAWEDELDSSNLGMRAETRAAAFGEAVARLGSGTVLTLGARGDTHDRYGSFFAPSIAAAHPVGGSVRLKGSVARSFRAPTWTERYYADPFHQASASISPEDSWSYELGAELRPRDEVAVSMTVFARTTDNLIDWAKPDGSDEDVRWVTRNVSEADFTGVELDAALADFAGASWRAGVAFLDMDAKGEEGFFSKRALQPETRRTTISVTRALGSRVAVSAHGLYAKRLSQDDYHQVDVRVSSRLRRGEIYLDLVNVTDQRYLDASGKSVPSTGIFLGYRLGG